MNNNWPSSAQRSREPRNVTPIVNATAVTASTCESVAVAAMVSMTVGSDAPCAEAAAAPLGGAANGAAANDASPNGRLASDPSVTPGLG